MDKDLSYNEEAEQLSNGQEPMSTERAQRDLAALQQEIRRLELTLSEKRDRALKLEHYIEVSGEYAEGPSGPSATSNADDTTHPNGQAKPKAPKGGIGGRAVQECVTILRDKRQYMMTRKLHDLLQERGIHLGGDNPVGTLSSYLSRTPELVSDRTAGGWGLKEWE
jgi:hypothetical protein